MEGVEEDYHGTAAKLEPALKELDVQFDSIEDLEPFFGPFLKLDYLRASDMTLIKAIDTSNLATTVSLRNLLLSQSRPGQQHLVDNLVRNGLQALVLSQAMLRLTETVRNREELDYDGEEVDREGNGHKVDIATVFDYHRQAKAIV